MMDEVNPPLFSFSTAIRSVFPAFCCDHFSLEHEWYGKFKMKLKHKRDLQCWIREGRQKTAVLHRTFHLTSLLSYLSYLSCVWKWARIFVSCLPPRVLLIKQNQANIEHYTNTKVVHPLVFSVQKRGGHQSDRRRDREGEAGRWRGHPVDASPEAGEVLCHDDSQWGAAAGVNKTWLFCSSYSHVCLMFAWHWE